MNQPDFQALALIVNDACNSLAGGRIWPLLGSEGQQLMQQHTSELREVSEALLKYDAALRQRNFNRITEMAEKDEPLDEQEEQEAAELLMWVASRMGLRANVVLPHKRTA